MIEFGTGPTLVEGSPWLQDAAARYRRILEAVERNSVIEGLPPFTAELRQSMLRELEAMGDLKTMPDQLLARDE